MDITYQQLIVMLVVCNLRIAYYVTLNSVKLVPLDTTMILPINTAILVTLNMVIVNNVTPNNATNVIIYPSFRLVLASHVHLWFKVAHHAQHLIHHYTVSVAWMGSYIHPRISLVVYLVKRSILIVLLVIRPIVLSVPLVSTWTRLFQLVWAVILVVHHVMVHSILVVWHAHSISCWKMVYAVPISVTSHWLDLPPSRLKLTLPYRFKTYRITLLTHSWVVWIISNSFVIQIRTATWMDVVSSLNVDVSPPYLDLGVNTPTPQPFLCRPYKLKCWDTWHNLVMSISTMI